MNEKPVVELTLTKPELPTATFGLTLSTLPTHNHVDDKRNTAPAQVRLAFVDPASLAEALGLQVSTIDAPVCCTL